MNVQGDFRYVTEDGFRDWSGQPAGARAQALGQRAGRAARSSLAALT